MAKELWDAYDREGNLLGYDLVRGEPVPEGVYHLVVEIYPVTHDGRILVTRRHPDKTWGLYWEITGGSVVKGEKPLQAAVRELREETGIIASESDMIPVYVQNGMGLSGSVGIFHSFITFFDPDSQEIRLQEGETVDWKLLTYEEYKEFVKTDEFTAGMRRRFLTHQEAFDRIIGGHIGGK